MGDDGSCHSALPDGRSEATRNISVYHHCFLAEPIYEVSYCAKELLPAKTARDTCAVHGGLFLSEEKAESHFDHVDVEAESQSGVSTGGWSHVA
jgi:hypothetical protein